MTTDVLKNYTCQCGYHTDKTIEFQRHLLDGARRDGKGVHKSLKRAINSLPPSVSPDISSSDYIDGLVRQVNEVVRKRVEKPTIEAPMPSVVEKADSEPPTNKKKVKPPKPNAFVIDIGKSDYDLEYIENPPGLPEWYYEGQYVHWLKRHNGHIEIVKLPDEVDYMPEKLYRALNWVEARPLFAIKPTFLEKAKVGLMFALVGLLLFFIFLITQS